MDNSTTKKEEIPPKNPQENQNQEANQKKEEPKKKEEPLKKEEAKKEEVKKEEPKKDDKELKKKEDVKENDNKKVEIKDEESQEQIVIKDEPPKQSCCKGFCKWLGRCCTGCGHCIVRFLYCLFSDRAMIFVNIIAIAAILVSIGERLSWVKYSYIPFAVRSEEIRELMKSPEYKENTSAYYYILVAFLLIFSIFFLLAEFRVKSARETFSMLDTKGGRGFFLIFLGLMIPQNKNGVAIAMSVITNLIGMLNILVGYN